MENAAFKCMPIFVPLRHVTCERPYQVATNKDETFTFAITAVLCKPNRMFILILRKALFSSCSNILNLALLIKKDPVEKFYILYVNN